MSTWSSSASSRVVVGRRQPGRRPCPSWPILGVLLVGVLFVGVVAGCDAPVVPNTSVFLPAASAHITRVDAVQTTTHVLFDEANDDVVDEQTPLLVGKPTRLRVYVSPRQALSPGTLLQARLVVELPADRVPPLDDGGVDDSWWTFATAPPTVDVAKWSTASTLPVDDGGVLPVDGGALLLDAGPPTSDAGIGADAGFPDAGILDAGILDAGVGGDAGHGVADAGGDAGVDVIAFEQQTLRRIWAASTVDAANSTLNFDLPGSWMQPGMQVRVELLEEVLLLGGAPLFLPDPHPHHRWPRPEDDGRLDESDGGIADGGVDWPTAQLPLDDSPTPTLVLLPLLQPGTPLDDDVPRWSDDSVQQLRERLVTLFPFADVEVLQAPPVVLDEEVTPFAEGWEAALFTTSARHLMGTRDDDTNVFTIGLLMPDGGRSSFCPLSCVEGLAPITEDGSRPAVGAAVVLGPDDDDTVWSVAHEWGHLLGRRHAPCGVDTDVDDAFPSDDGALSAPGFDALDRDQAAASRTDVMGYCAPQWTSAYTYNALFDALQPDASTTLPPETAPAALASGGQAVLFGAGRSVQVPADRRPAGVWEWVSLVDNQGQVHRRPGVRIAGTRGHLPGGGDADWWWVMGAQTSWRPLP